MEPSGTHDDGFEADLARRYEAIGRFGHREHLDMCREHVIRYGMPGALDAVVDFIRHVAAAHGAPDKFNDTLTRFWVRVVAAAMNEDGGDLDALLASHPHLLDTELPLRHWSRELLFSPAAKVRWVDPDLAPLGR